MQFGIFVFIKVQEMIWLEVNFRGNLLGSKYDRDYHHNITSLIPQSRYDKIDAYLLNLVSRDFWRQTVTLFSSYKSYKYRRVLNTQIIQKIISKHHPVCECRETSPVDYISLQTVVTLNVLKFELQYGLTPPQIFFCGYRLLQLFCHSGEGAHDIKCSQK